MIGRRGGAFGPLSGNKLGRMKQPTESRLKPPPGALRRLMGYLRAYRAAFIGALVVVLISAGLHMVLPWLIKDVLDSVLVKRDAQALGLVSFALLALFIATSVFGFTESWLLNYVGNGLTRDMRQQLYEHLQKLSLGFFEQHHTGDLVSRLTNDVGQVQSGITGNLIALVRQPFTLIIGLVVLVKLQPTLALIALSVAPVLVLFGRMVSKPIGENTREVQERRSDLNVFIQESLSGVAVVRSFTLEPSATRMFRESNQKLMSALMRNVLLGSGSGAGFGLLSSLPVVLIFGLGGKMVLDGVMSPGSLIAFILYVQSVTGPVTGLAHVYVAFIQAVSAAQRVFDVLDTQPEVLDLPDAKPLTPGEIRGRVGFEHVSFRYATSGDVLHDLNLDIEPGEVLALVGPSGSGKTTLAKLLPRFYDPTEGAIRLDGRDLREIRVRDLRSAIGLVPQETYLFGLSIRENILMGRLDATQEEVEQAARLAFAHDFISELEEGYDSHVGERGVRLSGGQRQRIAIARVLLKDPRILLLDEATSALDTESERLVQQALNNLMRGRTCLVIAHRLSTVRHANRIAVLNHGRIVELGSHEELLSRGGLYSRLYELQFEMWEDEVSASR